MTSKTYAFPAGEADAIAAKIHAAGGPKIDPAQPGGEVKHDGVDIRWSIADNTITVTLVGRSFYDPSEADIWTKLDGLFGGDAPA